MGERVLALREGGGKVHLIKIEDREIKVRGVGRINPSRDLKDAKPGDKISVGQKEFLVLKPRLRELTEGMRRRAQIITPKDASLLTSMLGITSGDRVLELGFGSAGLTLHLANVIGKNAHPFFVWAKDSFGISAVPKWNFHKIIINKEGKVSKSFSSITRPKSKKFLNQIELEIKS